MGLWTYCNVMRGRLKATFSNDKEDELDRFVEEVKVAFDAGRRSLAGATYAPNRVIVRLNPDDAEFHQPLMARFKDNLAATLVDRVEQRGLAMIGRRFEVQVGESDDVPPGTVEVETDFTCDEDARDDTAGPARVIWDVDACTAEAGDESPGAEGAEAGIEVEAEVEAEVEIEIEVEDDTEDERRLVQPLPRSSFRILGAPPAEAAPGNAKDQITAADADPDAEATRLEADHGTRCVADRAIFEMIGGLAAGAIHTLGDGIHVVGRGKDCEIRLPTVDDLSSRRHLRLIVRGDTVAVDDLQSGNGTFVNGSRVDHSQLQVGDVIRVGRSNLRLVQRPGANA